MADSTNTWLIYALGSMLLFSVSNVLLKVTVGTASLSKLNTESVIGIAVTIIVAATVIYFLFLKPVLTGSSVTIVIVLAMLSLFGVGLEILALQTGQVALVNAVLGFSTIGVAVLSYFFLGDRFSSREIIAIILATASVLILIF